MRSKLSRILHFLVTTDVLAWWNSVGGPDLAREAYQVAGAMGKLFADVYPAKALAGFLGGIAGYFFPEQVTLHAFYATFGLIVLDMVTGISAAAVSGESIASAKFARTAMKLLAYGSLIIVAAVVPKYVVGAGAVETVSVNFMMSLMLLGESKSIAENAEKMGYGFPWLMRWLRARIRQAETSLQEPAKDHEEDGAAD
ncbi:MAG: hypothetical protein EON58_02230 [Alphaproteobacteria bacterium]|nr:MAG: hypothetical protein EON58_02230 [Alphaproteobacteria bacterium]